MHPLRLRKLYEMNNKMYVNRHLKPLFILAMDGTKQYKEILDPGDDILQSCYPWTKSTRTNVIVEHL